jgi:hypothetical protein
MIKVLQQQLLLPSLLLLLTTVIAGQWDVVDAQSALLQSPLQLQHQQASLGKCERITIPLCKDMKYNMTRMPNLVGQTTQKDATLQVIIIKISLIR